MKSLFLKAPLLLVSALVLAACDGGSVVTPPDDVGTGMSSVQASSQAMSVASSAVALSSSSLAVVSSSSVMTISSDGVSSQALSSAASSSSSAVQASSQQASSSSEATPGDFDLVAGGKLYVDKGCVGCHGDDGQQAFPGISEILPPYQKFDGEGQQALAAYIDRAMPLDPTDCVGDCAQNIAAYMLAGFTAGGDEGGGDYIGDAAQAERVKAGQKVYSDNACGLCHRDDGSTLVGFGADKSLQRSLLNCPSCSSYGALVSSIDRTMPKGEDTEFGPHTCVGDCATAAADYIWVEIIKGQLTSTGGDKEVKTEIVGADTLRVKSYDSIAADYERVFGEVPASLEASESAFRDVPDYWYEERSLGAVSLNILANAAVEACGSEELPAMNDSAIRVACDDWAERMWLRRATSGELDSCVNTAMTVTDGLSTSKKRLVFTCASMMISIPALTY